MLETRIAELLKPHADGVDFTVERPKHEGHGDYATNLALILAKQQGKNPREVAAELQKAVSGDPLFSAVEVAGPGFLNFTIADDQLLQTLTAQPDAPSKQGTVVIELSHPNIAKQFSIGHLRSTIIGQALCNLYSACGWKVVSTNHLGDWGTQFGKMIVAVEQWADKPADQLTIEELQDLYVKFHAEAEQRPELEDQARAKFAALEQGDPDARTVWKQLVMSSMKEFNRLYKRLGTNIEHELGESDYEDRIQPVVALLKEKGLAKESDGAVIVLFPNDALPPAMALKSDGASTYFIRDLGAIQYRQEHWQPDRLIWEVGSEQELHFRQVHYAAELLGWGSRDIYKHVQHGLVRLPEGKMNTRKGRVIKLEPVLNEAVARAAKINPDSAVAEAVGIGAIKYNDLKRSPHTGYSFDWDEMLSLEGNSGPYIQYVYARCQAILRKAGDQTAAVPTAAVLESAERELIIELERFTSVITAAAETYSPNTLTTYLFELTQRFNRFYEQCPVLKADPSVRAYRLQIIRNTADAIHRGLRLLGIEAPGKM